VLVIVLVVLVALVVATVVVFRRRRRDWRLPRRPVTAQTDHTALRVLGDGEPTRVAAEPVRPRVDTTTPLVFGEDTTPVPIESFTGGRHSDQWALDRSAHRGRLSVASWRVVVVAAVALTLLFGAGWLVSSQHTTPHHPSTTTTGG
jgi:Flp pilus assembly protein TadB